MSEKKEKMDGGRGTLEHVFSIFLSFVVAGMILRTAMVDASSFGAMEPSSPKRCVGSFS